MRLSTSARLAVLALLPAGLLVGTSAAADTLNLNYTASYDGSPAGVVDYATVNAVLNTPAATSINQYVRTFDAAFSAAAQTIPGTSYEFYDDYIFTISESAVSNYTATIDLQNLFNIDNLSVRLFEWSGDAEQSYSNTGTGPQVTLGGVTPTGSAVQSWTNLGMGSSETQTIENLHLTAGTYVLQIRGNVNGTAGGGYTGALQIAPVPLPAAGWLLVSGVTGLLGIVRRRRNA